MHRGKRTVSGTQKKKYNSRKQKKRSHSPKMMTNPKLSQGSVLHLKKINVKEIQAPMVSQPMKKEMRQK